MQLIYLGIIDHYVQKTTIYCKSDYTSKTIDLFLIRKKILKVFVQIHHGNIGKT